MSNLDQRHLAYYEKELHYLREMGKAFAQKFPRVASRIAFDENVSPDPHTERLVESFAYLTSYLQKDIDDQFPRLAETLMDILYPQLVAPLPSMSVAHFQMDPKKGKSTTGYTIPRHSPLFAKTDTDSICRFRTSYDVTLWPIAIEAISLKRTASFDFMTAATPYPFCLSVKLTSKTLPFSKMDLSRLRFYISSNTITANSLYEMLFLTDHQVGIRSATRNGGHVSAAQTLGQVGFGKDENVLPDFPQSLSSYRLLQEYFAFPQKFLFFDCLHLNTAAFDHECELLIPLATHDIQAIHDLEINNESLKLGCTPIINLFPKTTDPIRFDKRQVEYHLNPDIRKELTTEIHSVEKVVQTVKDSSAVKTLSPYFSYDHGDMDKGQRYFWFKRRVAAPPGLPGTRLMMSFVDLDFNPKTPADEVIYAKTLCTNRGLANLLHANTVLQAESSLPVTDIRCLHQPTPSIYQSKDGATLWKMISQLSLNYLSLSNDQESLKAFQEIIRLYGHNIAQSTPTEIAHILAMERTPIVRRMGQDAWRGMVRGMGITLTLDQNSFERKDALLFSAVLSHFLNLYASVNAFAELSIHHPQQDKVWKTWSIQQGLTPLI